MSPTQKWRLLAAYGAVGVAALVLILFNAGGMVPGLMLVGAIIGGLHLCFLSVEPSDYMIMFRRPEGLEDVPLHSTPTPPEPDYAREGTLCFVFDTADEPAAPAAQPAASPPAKDGA